MDTVMSEEIQEQMYSSVSKSGSGAAKLSSSYLKTITATLENITISTSELKNNIQKLLDKSKAYFSGRKETIYEDLFNSNNSSGLEEYDLLHPKIRKLFLEDIHVKDIKYVGKIDVYIDISGSMSGNCGIKNTKGYDITRLDFCKSFVAKLKSLGILNQLYVFNDGVKPYKNDLISIAMLTDSGGTNINRVVKTVRNNKGNAIIITDAEDQCGEYTENAFFIGVQGANFRNFSSSTISQYSKNGQVIIFNGSTIRKVNEEGSPV
jgi:uncharacterized protein with von Willebrand factor type A (vWA) domain